MAAVRKIFLLFLLALMPLQLTWAAVLSYCPDESSMSALHFAHQAQGCLKAQTGETPNPPTQAGASPEANSPSLDVHHHHLSDHGSALVGEYFQALTVFAWHAAGAWPAENRVMASSAPPSAIERPKWLGSSAFCGGV